jgi:hypothetical protein
VVINDTEATNVPSGTPYVTQAEMDALNAKITAAEKVKYNDKATQTEVDNATTALKAAITDFDTAKQKTGTSTTIVAADKTTLEALIAAANAAKVSVVVVPGTVPDDTAAETVYTGNIWVKQMDLAALNAAITAAEAVRTKAAATQANVNIAVTDLLTAIRDFDEAKEAGMKPPVDITLWPDADDRPIFTTTGTTTITATGSFTATVAAGYTVVRWYVDGASPTPVVTTNSITINGSAYSNDIGRHRLSVTVKDGTDAFYSKEITFTVTN